MKSNPFATRFVRPGEIQWLSGEEFTVPRLADRFRCHLNSRATIVGPHGTGKTTLLRHLIPHLGTVRYQPTTGEAVHTPTSAAGDLVWLGLRKGHAPLRTILASYGCWQPGGTLILDGLEQLRHWEQWLAFSLIRFRGMGFLATSHRKISYLSILHETTCPIEILQSLVACLLDAHDHVDVRTRRRLVDPQLLSLLLTEEQGNAREVFMRLYDVFEQFPRIHDNSRLNSLA